MLESIDSTIFDKPLHVVPLGHMSPNSDGRFIVTLDDLPDRISGGWAVTEEDAALLSSINIFASNREFTEAEKSSLLQFANLGVVKLIPADTNVYEISLVPVRRRQINPVAGVSEDGQLIPLDSKALDGEMVLLRVRVEDSDETMDLINPAAMMLPRMDGERSLGDLAQQIAREARSLPKVAAAIAAMEAEDGVGAFERDLFAVTMELLQETHALRVISIEAGLEDQVEEPKKRS